MPVSNKTRAGRRERVISAASEVFLERGFAHTTTEEIARRAKVSKREIYENFKSKRAMLTAVITELQAAIEMRMNLRWSSDGGLEETLSCAGETILTFILSNRFGRLLRIVASECLHDASLGERFLELGPVRGRRATAQFIARQMKLGKLRNADPLQAADDFLNIVVSPRLIMSIVFDQELPRLNTREHVRRATDAFLRIYGPEDGRLTAQPALKASRKKPSTMPKIEPVSR